jgi:hypothetical protein
VHRVPFPSDVGPGVGFGVSSKGPTVDKELAELARRKLTFIEVGAGRLHSVFRGRVRGYCDRGCVDPVVGLVCVCVWACLCACPSLHLPVYPKGGG